MDIDKDLKTWIESWAAEIKAARDRKGVAPAPPPPIEDCRYINPDVAIKHLEDIILGSKIWSLNQSTYGCCGFAAALMALARHPSGGGERFQELCKLVFSPKSPDPTKHYQVGGLVLQRGAWIKEERASKEEGRPHKNPAAKQFFNLRERLVKRETFYHEWNAGGSRSLPDITIMAGLMILFKEHLRTSKRLDDLKYGCVKFSQVFNWEAVSKPDFGYVPRASGGPYMNFKHGDLALTRDALIELVHFVFDNIYLKGKHTPIALQRQATDNLIGLNLYEESDADAADNMTPKKTAKLKKLQEDINKDFETQRDAALSVLEKKYLALPAGHHGMIVGVIGGKSCATDKYVTFNLLTHWVYLPPGSAAGDLKVWTWGKETKFTNADFAYVPIWGYPLLPKKAAP